MLNSPAAAVLVFARVPGTHTAKSRLAAGVGRDEADRIYLRLLRRTSRVVEGKPYHVTFPDDTGPGSLRDMFGGAQSFFVHTGPTLGDRLRTAFEHLHAFGVSIVCAVGCDCPTMSSSDIDRALELLNRECDVVLGPAEDGGYYLVGAKPGCMDVFSVDGWSTSRLLRQTLGVCERKGYRCRLLDRRYDVDTIEDYRRWRQEQGS